MAQQIELTLADFCKILTMIRSVVDKQTAQHILEKNYKLFPVLEDLIFNSDSANIRVSNDYNSKKIEVK